MTHRDFSISSSERSSKAGSAATYVAFMVGGTIALLVAVAIFSHIALRHDLIDIRNTKILNHQIRKLDTAAPVRTLFVGDSSLGAMFDQGVWSAVAGEPAMQLALTGTYGYAGSYSMIVRALERFRPDTIVLVHALDMMTRDLSTIGYVLARPLEPLPALIPAMNRLTTRLSFYLDSQIVGGAMGGVMRAAIGRESNPIENGFLRQPDVAGAVSHIATGDYLRLRPERINPQKTLFLKQIAKLCARKGINCIYAHGPVFAGACEAGAAYLQAINEDITDAGLIVAAESPSCVPQPELSNTINHVRKDLKPAYTRRYHGLLAPYLN